ncbi:hypothetical protein LINPERHAP2_LOCUS40111, partial [Linum perenne]
PLDAHLLKCSVCIEPVSESNTSNLVDLSSFTLFFSTSLRWRSTCCCAIWIDISSLELLFVSLFVNVFLIFHTSGPCTGSR